MLSKVIIEGSNTMGSTIFIKFVDSSGNIISNNPNYDLIWIGDESVSFMVYRDSPDQLQYYEIPKYDNKWSIKIDRGTPSFLIVKINDGTSDYYSNLFYIDKSKIPSTIDQASQRVEITTIGKGINYNTPVSNASGTSNVATNLARINQSLQIILNTARGTVPMLPSLGCGIHSMLYDIITPTLIEDIRLDVEQSITEQEPRVNVLRVSAEWDEEHTISVEVLYSIVDTNIESAYIYNYEVGGEVLI